MDLGKSAGVRDVLNLASQYKVAAIKLGEAPPSPNHLPQRLLALHAIELYLDALLQAKGLDDEPIRNFQHDLGERARIALAPGLVLRNRTLAAWQPCPQTKITHGRYAHELSSTLSQVNRVMATLEIISRKGCEPSVSCDRSGPMYWLSRIRCPLPSPPRDMLTSGIAKERRPVQA